MIPENVDLRGRWVRGTLSKSVYYVLTDQDRKDLKIKHPWRYVGIVVVRGEGGIFRAGQLNNVMYLEKYELL